MPGACSDILCMLNDPVKYLDWNFLLGSRTLPHLTCVHPSTQARGTFSPSSCSQKAAVLVSKVSVDVFSKISVDMFSALLVSEVPVDMAEAGPVT